MQLNESLKNEVLRCLNESKLNESEVVTTKSQGNKRPSGASEWTFADWFGEDLTGKTYKGDINCRFEELTSLKGAPEKVEGNFDCRDNDLTSLEGAPEEVTGSFYCNGNKLTSFEGAPEKVEGNFDCRFNRITSLKGAPKEVGGGFDCSYNEELNSVDGLPEKVGGKFRYENSENFVRQLISNADKLPSYLARKYSKFASGKKQIIKVNNPNDTVWFYGDDGGMLLLGISESPHGYEYGATKFGYRGAGTMYVVNVGSGIFKVDYSNEDDDVVVGVNELPSDVSLTDEQLINYNKPFYIQLKSTIRSGKELLKYISMIEDESEGVIDGRSYNVYQ